MSDNGLLDCDGPRLYVSGDPELFTVARAVPSDKGPPPNSSPYPKLRSLFCPEWSQELTVLFVQYPNIL